MSKIKKWIKNHKWLVFLFFFSFVIRLGVVLWIHTPIISDFKTMYEAALELVNGTDSYKTMPYFICWGYQMGHVIYQAFLLAIINSVTFLKIMNAIITSFTVVFIYLIGKELSTEKAARIISIIYSIFLFPLLLNTVLTNQFLPMLLILIAIYILIKKKKDSIHLSIIIGILLGFSNIFRSETIVVIVALFLYSIYLLFIKERKKKVIISFLCILISYVVIFQGTSFLLKATNVSPSGLDNNNSSWKFLEGLNVSTSGRYSAEDAEKYAYDKEKTQKALQERIENNYLQFPKLMLKKIKITWLSSDLSWSLGHIKNQDQVKMVEAINQCFVYFFFIMALLSAITIFKKIYKKQQILILLILFVYFGVYLLIEVMPRYAYAMQTLEAILACVTLGYILDNKPKKVGEQHGKTKK